MKGHFSLKEAGETINFMVNMSENGRKPYLRPKFAVVELKNTDIIATSTGASGEDGTPDW